MVKIEKPIIIRQIEADILEVLKTGVHNPGEVSLRLIKIILQFIVTVFTLGLCYPWAHVMLYRWKVTHTVIDGRRLKFDGTAVQLFGNWIKWWILTIITGCL
jgi:uncharacterized membrane protein YjgN (DUF898 family)